MQKDRRLLTGAMCAWLLFLIAPPLAAQCMLANPSFEVLGSAGSVFAGWNQFGPVGSSTSALHGGRAARVTGPNSGTWNVSGYWQAMACAPGKRWSTSVNVFHSSTTPLTGGSQAILNIEWRGTSGNLISYESHAAAAASTPTDVWRVYSVESQAAPTGTASIHFVLGVLQGPTDPTPQVLFDAPTCVSMGPPTLESLQWSDFPGGRTVDFSGRVWRVKGPGFYGPGPNLFDNGSNAVWVDAVGRLHMTIHKIGASWHSSEVVLNDALGYGDYVFTTRGRLDQFDVNTVLGLFLWEYGACYDVNYLWWNPYNEIDVEFSRWGNPGNANMQFVAQPFNGAGNLVRFNVTFADSELTSHAMRWLPGRVEYRSWRGGPDAESTANMIASWTYTGAHIPRPEAPRVHLNMWQLAAPTATQETVFDAFTFRPACPSGTCQIVAVPPLAPPSGPLAILTAAMPNPFASAATIRYSTAVSGHVELVIYDISGRRVRSLVSGVLGAGAHEVGWNRLSDDGARARPGLYLARLRALGTVSTRRLIVTE